jgi:hypothetical protein
LQRRRGAETDLPVLSRSQQRDRFLCTALSMTKAIATFGKSLVSGAARQTSIKAGPLLCSRQLRYRHSAASIPSYTASLPARTPHTSSFPRNRNTVRNNRSTQYNSRRLCSTRRNMCRRANIEAASAAVPNGRQLLPANVKPVHYDLTLEPEFETFTYDGTVKITSVFIFEVFC